MAVRFQGGKAVPVKTGEARVDDILYTQIWESLARSGGPVISAVQIARSMRYATEDRNGQALKRLNPRLLLAMKEYIRAAEVLHSAMGRQLI